jgi:hypothetical protein
VGPVLRRQLSAALVATIVYALGQRRAVAADDWLARIDALARALRAGELDAAQWGEEIVALAEAIDLDDLLRRTDFDRVAESMRWPERGAATQRVLLGSGAIVKLFGLRRGHALVPHGHDGIASMHLIVHGRVRGRHYDRIGADGRSVLLRVSEDRIERPGDASSVTRERDNVHWFLGEANVSFAFGVAIENLDPAHASKRVYLDPERARVEAGDVLRVPVIDRAAAMRRYGAPRE